MEAQEVQRKHQLRIIHQQTDGHIQEVKTIVGGMLGTEKGASTVGSRITCSPNVEQKGI